MQMHNNGYKINVMYFLSEPNQVLFYFTVGNDLENEITFFQ